MDSMFKEEAKFQGMLIAVMLCALIAGCNFAGMFRSTTPMDIATITLAAKNFDKVVTAIKTLDFNEEEIAKLEKAEEEFKEVVAAVTVAGNVITLDQIVSLRDASKTTYKMAHPIIMAKIADATLTNRMLILNFHGQMVNIDIWIDKMIEEGVEEGDEEFMREFLAFLSIAAQVVPAFL